MSLAVLKNFAVVRNDLFGGCPCDRVLTVNRDGFNPIASRVNQHRFAFNNFFNGLRFGSLDRSATR